MHCVLPKTFLGYLSATNESLKLHGSLAACSMQHGTLRGEDSYSSKCNCSFQPSSFKMTAANRRCEGYYLLSGNIAK